MKVIGSTLTVIAGALLLLTNVMAQAPAATYRAPRTPDGKPNLNGIWQAMNTANWNIGTWQLGRTRLNFTPQVTAGMVRLRHDTYNPSNPGGSFPCGSACVDAAGPPSAASTPDGSSSGSSSGDSSVGTPFVPGSPSGAVARRIDGMTRGPASSPHPGVR